MTTKESIFKRAKAWLARVNETSWHYRLIEEADVRVPQKACTYYWLCVPWAAIKMICFLFLVAFFFMAGYFFGFTLDWKEEKKDRKKGDLYFDYKTTRKGKRKWATPWEIVVITFLGWLGYQIVLFTMDNTQIIGQFILNVIPYVFYTAAVVCIMVALLNIFRRPIGLWMGRQPENLKKFWDRVCPELTVVKKTQK